MKFRMLRCVAEEVMAEISREREIRGAWEDCAPERRSVRRGYSGVKTLVMQSGTGQLMETDRVDLEFGVTKLGKIRKEIWSSYSYQPPSTLKSGKCADFMDSLHPLRPSIF